ncbi:MAG: alpha-(1-_3)-arabinofuranosyltransferase family protein, partial [Acidimicrobiales bacterium]
MLAVVCYVPLLFTHVGMIGADTKQYLYLDPGRLLSRAWSMWDPNVGMGTVTHQNIGYLLPMGPWYSTLHAVGVPTWVAQRLWTGTLLFLAGLGVVYLLRCMGPTERPADSEESVLAGRAVLLAALAYSLSPYVLEYEARISAILMPWAAMPWMIALVVRGLRRPGWRYPALFALVVALCGGVNATSLIYAGIAPVLWIPYAVWVIREVPWRRAVTTVAQVGVLTVAGSLWWMSGLWAQANYGLDVLRYTETVQVVAQTGTPIEVLRGLGNWYFYGRDTVAPWVQPAAEYTQQLWRLLISYLVPFAALVGAVSTRWRHKVYFVGLMVVGLVIAVGVYPYSHPSPSGAVFKAVANSSSAGLALRSVGRAAPLVVLGTSVLLAAGLDALARWRPRAGAVAAGVAGAVILLNMAPLFTGQFVDDNLQRPEAIPAYWTQAIAALDKGSHSTRILELPGSDFSHYRWGTTLDPIIPGLTDRPYVSRELIPYGSAPSADLLRALDEGLQEGIFEPSALAPIARLMNVGAVVLRSDLQYERFRTPRPRSTWEEFSAPVPSGLSAPVLYGPTVAETPIIPLTDEISLATPPTAPNPPAVAIFDVPGTADIVHTETAQEPLVVAGDGQGLVDAAAAGILDARGGPILYSADLASNPAAMTAALADGADLLLTDTNRQRGQRWGTIRDNNGYTEQAGEQPITTDLTDNRLPVFPGATAASSTVAEQIGVKSVRATAYGNPVSYDPAHRPDQALDGDPLTSWTEGAFSDVTNQTLRIDLTGPVTADHISLVQPLVKPNERWVTKATLFFDGSSTGIPISLGPSSRTAAGETFSFPSRTFSRLDIRIDASNFGKRADYRGGSGVGFAEVRIPGVAPLTEVDRLPTDLLTAAGTASLDHRLEIELTRLRAQPLESFVSDPELSIQRSFDLPTGRTFALRGTARLSATASDASVDAALGRPGTAAGATVATSGSSMPGDLESRASAAVDGNPATAWQTEFGDQRGNWIEVTSAHPATVDHIDLTVVADGRHSVPTEVRVQADGGAPQDVTLPAVTDAAAENATTTVRVPLTSLTGSKFRITVLAVRSVTTINYFSQVPQPMPLGIAEVAIPGVTAEPPLPGTLPAACRSDLLTIDGKPIPLLASGSTTDAV